MSSLARDEIFHQFRKCNQCHGDLHNKYLILIIFPFMNQNQEKEMARVGQRKCYMMTFEAKDSPCETLEKFICNQEIRSSLCLQSTKLVHISHRAQLKVTQMCIQLPGCVVPSEYETTCTARYWNAKKPAGNPKESWSASVSLCIPFLCRISLGLRWRSYYQVIQHISRDFLFLSWTQGSTHILAE